MSWNLKNRALSSYFYIALFFVASSTLRYLALNQTEYANGWDGYYYVMQAHSWIKYGYLQSLDYSIIYPYFIGISYLLGDFILAYKVGAAVLSGGLIISAFLLVHRLSNNKIAAILISTILIFSPTVTYMVSQFPKNVLGLIFLILFLKSISTNQKLWAVIFFLLSVFTHRMTGGICLIIGAICLMNLLNWKWIISGLVFITLVSLLPGIVHYSDFERFSGQIATIPQFAPYSFFKMFQSSISIWWTLELALSVSALLFLAFRYFKNMEYASSNIIDKWVWPLLIFIMLFPFFIMQSGSMGYRFFLLAPILISIYLLCNVNIKRKWLIGLSASFIIMSIFSYKSYNPVYHDPPNKLYQIITDRLAKEYSPSDFPLVIVHKSLAEMIIYSTKFDALNWAPPKDSNQDKVLRIIHNLDPIHISKHLSEEQSKKFRRLTLHYFVTSESSWQHYLTLVKSENDYEILRRIEVGNNPMFERPFYLKKGKNL